MTNSAFRDLNEGECANINGGAFGWVAGCAVFLGMVAKDILDHYGDFKAAIKEGYKEQMAVLDS